MTEERKELVTIVLPEGDQPRTTAGTRVFVGDKEILDITKIEMNIEPDSILEATITVGVGEVRNLESVVSSRSIEEQLKSLADVYGYTLSKNDNG